MSEAIRENPASMAASNVSAMQEVRDYLFDLQQQIAREHNVVMDGRDIGTVVLPQAQVKIFLTAAPEERARRRQRQLAEKGIQVDFDQLLEEVKQRDWQDSHRDAAPLRQAEDAILCDTTHLDLDQSVDKILQIVKERLS